MYGSSVIFALERVPANLRSLVALNPMVPIIEGFRCAFLGHGLVTRAEFTVSFCLCAALFFIGLILFNRTEQSAMDAV
jgi:lipopolysaccharide transport system permease protein